MKAITARFERLLLFIAAIALSFVAATAHGEDTPAWLYKTAMWSQKGDATAWTDLTLRLVRANIKTFEKARDVEEFCPGYAAATASQREACWLRVISAITFKESGFVVDDEMEEDAGVLSIGLLALTVGECGDADHEDLIEPLTNLSCGVSKMAGYIGRDAYISGPNWTGAAAYWSVLRNPYSTARFPRLGYRAEIIELTKVYLQFAK